MVYFRKFATHKNAIAQHSYICSTHFRKREGQNIYPEKKHFWHQSQSVSLPVAKLTFQNLQEEKCRILFSVRCVKSKMGYLNTSLKT